MGGNGGSLNVGSPGNVATFIVGRSLTGGTATGLVDLSTLESLSVNVNQLLVGTSPTNAGTTSGTLKLAETTTIDAKSIVVGEFGNSNNLLRLGNDTTILTDELTVAKQRSHGRVELPPGATFRLGSVARPANLTVGDTIFDTAGVFYTGEVDLSGGTVMAYLNNVVLAKKDIQQGAVNGTLTIGASTANSVLANRISIGVGPGSARGTLNFAGGFLAADVIERGTGTATFNWIGGTLRVNTFGNGVQLFDLSNTGSGLLSPGDPVGTTIIRGNYVQGSSAAAQLDLRGTTPGMGHDQVDITGSATLAGTLDLRLSGGFAPVLGNTFDLFTFASRSGIFQNVLFPVLQGPAAFQLDYSNPTKVTLRMVTPQSINWIGPAPTSTWSNPANWSGGTVPTTNSDPQLFNSMPTAKEAVLDSDATVHRVTIGGTTATMGLAVPSNKTLHATDRVVIEEGGRLDLLQGHVTSSAIELSGGTLRGASETATPVVVQEGAIDVPDSRQALTLEGPLTIDANGSLLKTGPGELIVAGSLADGGNITVAGGTMVAPAAELDSLTLAGEGTIFRVRPGSGTMVLRDLSFGPVNPAAVTASDSAQLETIPEPKSIIYVVCTFVVLLVLRKFV